MMSRHDGPATAMSDEKVETVRSSSSGTVGRARSSARGVTVQLDSSSRPQADALTNSEAFLAGISSCGVTLIEMHAQESGVPLARMTATIEGVRVPPEPRFTSITMTFELAGVSQAQAEALVETYRNS
jgi:organic hydroperoxide reductase OsmC/OhrA